MWETESPREEAEQLKTCVLELGAIEEMGLVFHGTDKLNGVVGGRKPMDGEEDWAAPGGGRGKQRKEEAKVAIWTTHDDLLLPLFSLRPPKRISAFFRPSMKLRPSIFFIFFIFNTLLGFYSLDQY